MKNNFSILYERIGLLFYAAALLQRPLKMDDYDTLLNIIDINWKSGNGIPDRALRHELYQHIISAVKGAFRNSMAAGEASQLFKVFYSLHALSFDAALKVRVIDTYGQIEHAFSPDREDSERLESLKSMMTNRNP